MWRSWVLAWLSLLGAVSHAQGAGDAPPVHECPVLPVPIHVPASAPAALAVVAEADTFLLILLANVEFSQADEIAFGDTDHDGANARA